MKIICTKPEEYKMASALAEVAKAVGTQVEVVSSQDAYALTHWSINDIAEINDVRAKKIKGTEREKFMEFVERKLEENIIERGWETLNAQIGSYFSQKEKTNTQAK